MAHLLASDGRAFAAPFLAPAKWLASRLADRRRSRIQRLALLSLLELDPHQLGDLGLNRGDLFFALRQSPKAPTHYLEARRQTAACH